MAPAIGREGGAVALDPARAYLSGMGCDIHGIFQARHPETGAWVDVESNYDERRDYWLFAFLADVRNDGTFAPISEPRGLPEDFLMKAGEFGDLCHPVARVELLGDQYHEPQWALELDLGDHSHSWLTSTELLAWREANKDRGTEMDRARVEAVAYFFDEAARLQAKHGEVRFVFGFDS
jgi:hypothetical protein